MRFALALSCLLMLATPAAAVDKESLVKKVPNSKTRSVVVGKTPVFNIPEKSKPAATAQQRTNTPKAQRNDGKGTLLNDYPKRKDGWGHPIKSAKEEADAFFPHRNRR